MNLLRSFAILAVLNIAAVAALYLSYFNLERYEQKTVEKQEIRYRAYQLATIMRQDSQSLTRLARAYASTGDERFEEQFRDVSDIGAGYIPRPKNYHRIYWDFLLLSDIKPTPDGEPFSLLEMMEEAAFHENEIALFERSKFLSDELAEIESSVFQDLRLLKLEYNLESFESADWSDATFSKKHADINARLYDRKYNHFLVQIAEPINGFYKAVEDRTASEIMEIAEETEEQRLLTHVIMGFLILTFASSFLIIYLRIIKSAQHLRTSLNKMASGDLDVEIRDVHRNDEIGDMARSSEKFKLALSESINQNWVKSNANEIAGNLQQAEQVHEAAEFILRDLTPALNCVVGAFFYFNTDYDLLQRLASFGLSKQAGGKSTFELGDGLIGQCAENRKIMEIHNVPDDYGRVESGVGSRPVRVLYLFPVVQNDRLHGVLELGTFEPLTTVHQALLESIMPVLSLYLENLTRASKTQGLLVRSQNQAEELRASEEELRSQSEEIRASNEELRARTRQLAEKTAALQASEEELRVGNEELSAQTKTLEQRQVELNLAKDAAEVFADEMQRANQYKSQFLANMSHELRTPLNSLLILARILSDNKNGNLLEEDVEAASIIHDSGQHLLNLINDILDLSKTEAGKTELQPETIPIDSIVTMVKNSFGHVAEKNEVQFEVIVDEDLPKEIFVDPTKLQQVMNNLLSNAFKFTETGRVGLSLVPSSADEVLSSQLDPNHSYLACIVEDSGIGMTEQQLSSVFEAFIQADGSTSRKYGGTGLGLTITKSLVELMGGAVVATSVEGKGSKFKIILPQKFVENQRTHNSPSIDTSSNLTSKSENPVDHDTSAFGNVELQLDISKPVSDSIPFAIADDRDDILPGQQAMLIVEDDEDFAKLLLKQVREKGFRGIVATHPRDGLALARILRPIGIILDINLPDMDGWTVLQKLKANRQLASIPVHILSALSDPGNAIEKGAIGYSTKPTSLEAINDVIACFDGYTSDEKRKILLIEDDHASRVAIGKVMAEGNLETLSAGSAEEGMAALKKQDIDCIILDLGLPDVNGFEFLKQVEADETINLPPVVIYSGRELNRSEIEQLREFTDSVVIKGDHSAERLLSEVNLFLHSVEANLPEAQKVAIAKTKSSAQNKAKASFKGAHVLLADDDMRNVFALSKVLKDFGCKVTIAKNGAVAIEKLKESTDLSIILMDMMMPEMDGMEAIEIIRKDSQYDDIPIIAVTAKAMVGEREKCIAIGADDYLTKPVDIDELSSKMLALI